jgi:mRNA interferase MazF
MALNRFAVHLVNLDPTIGSEIRETRPCVIISPDEMNRHLRTVIVAPMTTKTRPYPSRVTCRFRKKTGQIALDQLRTIDVARLVKQVGTIDRRSQGAVLKALGAIFAP